MKKLVVVFSVLVFALFIAISLTGCREADRVSYNVSKEADNFNVLRRLAVINTVNGDPVFEMIGRFSIEVDVSDDQLEVVVEVGEGKYKKHIVGLNQATTMYVVEDIDGADVNKYKYEINYLPKAIQPFTITSND